MQVFFYLGELDVAVTYALGAGNLFDVNDESDYVQTLLCKPTPKFCPSVRCQGMDLFWKYATTFQMPCKH